jgi:hypothetical protein
MKGKLRRLGVLALALLLGAGLLFGRPASPHFAWERIPGLFALLGFVDTWLLVLGAKALGRLWLERDEKYYGD